MKLYLINVFTNSYFLLFITAALGAALGKIKIKGFSLGSAGGIFSGIVVGWAAVSIAKAVQAAQAPDSEAYSALAGLAGGTTVAQPFMMFFLLLFICAVGLSVGGKLKSIFNRTGIKLVVIGIFIPIVSMALTWGCLMVGPALMGNNYNGYEISGLYSGAMTNTAALGTSMEVVGDLDVQGRYAILSDEDKSRVLALAGEEDTTPVDQLSGEQIGKFLGKAKSYISTGYAISFPVGTVGIILAMTLISMFLKKNRGEREHVEKENARSPRQFDNGRPVVYSAVIFGFVVAVGIIIGNIEIPLGGAASFSLSAVGGVLISAMVFSNFTKIGPFDVTLNPKALAYVRELSLIFFMSVVGLLYGYDVVAAFSGAGLVIAVMAIVIEAVAIILSILLGRFLLKMNWGLLSGAICGGCTSSVGLGAALSTMDSDEPTLGYGVSQPFAILANVLLISLFHSRFFI